MLLYLIIYVIILTAMLIFSTALLLGYYLSDLHMLM